MKSIVPILSLSLFVAPSLSLAVESASHLADASDRASARPELVITTLGFGSCARQDRPQPIWDAINTAHCDAFVLCGDNIYADTSDPAIFREKYALLGAIPGFTELRQTTPLFATWDDHDYGLNDGGAGFLGAAAAQKEFCDFFQVPATSPRRSTAGIYDCVMLGPEGKRVQLILLDTRSFRSPLKKDSTNPKVNISNTDPGATMLGDDQWAWLERRLREPAEIRAVISSVSFLSTEHGSEKWANFPQERARFLELLRRTQAKGVVIISGDRHLAELSLLKSDDMVAYPLYDITTSGLNQPVAKESEYGSKNPQKGPPNRYRIHERPYTGSNFGLMRVKWDGPDPSLRLEVCGLDGEVVISHDVPFSKLGIQANQPNPTDRVETTGKLIPPLCDTASKSNNDLLNVSPSSESLIPKPGLERHAEVDQRMKVNDEVRYDICVYGGTSSGVIAAVQAKKMGKSVILVSPTKQLGGLTSGGLGFTDMGDERTVGGLSRDYFHRVWKYYQKPEAWKFQPAEAYKGSGQHGPAFNQELEIATVFEPHVAGQLFDQVLSESGVKLLRARLDLSNAIQKDFNRITAIRLESGKAIVANVFIDATYEGDLMAKAGVTYTIGREANEQYGEAANGIQKGQPGNQVPKGVDPYVKKGDPSSGLLPRVNATAGGNNGDGDKRIQAYCYRMCLTDVPENRLQVDKPAGYREQDYELLFRAIEVGQVSRFFKFSLLPNRKTDSNNDSGVSTDYIGMNYDYPDADYATRNRIEEAHKNWQLGLIWTLQNHPRVPEAIRKSHAKWGLPKDEFTDNANWSPQLYVREARRLVNEHVIDENDILKRTTDQSVGMGCYKMDSHHTQYHVTEDGFVTAEGDVQKSIKGPYEIDYRALIPKKQECSNLLVPVCLAASHIAYGSIRMESVFMILGQSAGTAAALAVDEGTSVQQVPYAKLKQRMEQDGQILKMPGPSL